MTSALLSGCFSHRTCGSCHKVTIIKSVCPFIDLTSCNIKNILMILMMAAVQNHKGNILTYRKHVFFFETWVKLLLRAFLYV